MSHIHTEPGQYDLTVSAYILRLDLPEPAMLLHRHKTLGKIIQPGGHVELDETPWQGIRHELLEETGYDLDQLAVLQPKLRLTSAPGDALHPQPVCLRSFLFSAALGHFHTDVTYAFTTTEAARHPVGPGESHELFWLNREQLAGLDPAETFDDVRQIGLFILDHLLADWEPVRVSVFTV